MKNYTLARPYAKAAYLFAKEHKEVELWSQFLGTLAQIFQNESMQHLLKNPAFQVQDLIDMVLDKKSKANEQFKNFLMLLSENHRLSHLPEIAELFEEDVQAGEAVREVIVKTAMKLSAAEMKSLEKFLNETFKQPVEMEVIEDTSLIGGLIIESEDTVIDNSLKGQLHRLKQNLTF